MNYPDNFNGTNQDNRSEYTRGEWYTKNVGCVWKPADPKLEVAIHIAGAGYLTIATCDHCGSEGEANARLIAAAPALLKALKEALGVVQMVDDAEGGQLDLLSKVHAAIAKAEGN